MPGSTLVLVKTVGAIALVVAVALTIAAVAASATLAVERRCATGLIPLPTSKDQGGPVETNCKWRIVRR
jgi:hypothetical protein